MVALGLVLLVACLVLGAGVALSNTDPAQAEVFGYSLGDLTLGGLFALGAAAGALAMLGLGLILVGAARKRNKRKATRHEVKEARGEAETLAEQNARLQAELEQERTPGDGDRGVTTDGRGKHAR